MKKIIREKIGIVDKAQLFNNLNSSDMPIRHVAMNCCINELIHHGSTRFTWADVKQQSKLFTTQDIKKILYIQGMTLGNNYRRYLELVKGFAYERWLILQVLPQAYSPTDEERCLEALKRFKLWLPEDFPKIEFYLNENQSSFDLKLFLAQIVLRSYANPEQDKSLLEPTSYWFTEKIITETEFTEALKVLKAVKINASSAQWLLKTFKELYTALLLTDFDRHKKKYVEYYLKLLFEGNKFFTEDDAEIIYNLGELMKAQSL